MHLLYKRLKFFKLCNFPEICFLFVQKIKVWVQIQEIFFFIFVYNIFIRPSAIIQDCRFSLFIWEITLAWRRFREWLRLTRKATWVWKFNTYSYRLMPSKEVYPISVDEAIRLTPIPKKLSRAKGPPTFAELNFVPR